MKGTIKSVTKVGMFNNMHTLDVEFNHSQGDKTRFYSTRDLTDPNCSYQVGREIEYTVKENGGGKLVPPNTGGGYQNSNAYQKNNAGLGRGASTNESILLQVCYKANMDVFGRDYRDSVEEYTKADFEWMSNFLKNL